MKYSKIYLQLIRADNPIGTWLLFLPCLFALCLLAKNNNVDLVYLSGLFFVGAFLMRSAGCIINDIFDKSFDKNVARTKVRPIASGTIGIFGAITFLAILLCFALLLLLQFNLPTIVLGFSSLLLVALYPLMKRITFYPQIFLGLVFSLGILFVSTAVLGKITLAIFVLYLSNIVWTTIYDTIYGYQDLEDDLKIGVKSTAIKFGTKPQKILCNLSLLYLSLLFLVGFLANLKFIYFVLVVLAVAQQICQIRSCNFQDSTNCHKKFKSNIWVGFIVLIAIILG